MDVQTDYYDTLASAFIRGQLQRDPVDAAQSTLFSTPLDTLSDADRQAIIQIGKQRELRIHRFKKTMELARVRKVLGTLKGLQPTNLLDIGSGRGAFLWPLLDTFPTLPVTCVDRLAYRVQDIQAVHDGGIDRLTAIHADVTALPFTDHAFDVVTMLEVLEHIPATEQALSEVCRVASRYVLLSVPSKEDDNPEHIHLFDQGSVREHLHRQGITRVSIDYVPGHMLVIAKVATS